MPSDCILIVDDDKAVLNLLKISIEVLWPEYQIITASNGQVALDELRQRPVRLLLTDFEMPRLNGLDLACAARQISPDMPIVLMTGSRCDEVHTKAVSMNLAGFLPKPFAIMQLKEILQRNGL